ncbi:MAG: manganese efflux pump MntP family protein [Defluviitaleaceae bacterium]|nr:manganese efflux pump MntP family protein [Defluviitaleaceae bacterium]
MTTLELFILAIGLSMDAFAVAVSIGLAGTRAGLKKALVVGAYFGGFQAGMPLIGFLVAMHFAGHVTAFSHWIAFVLLVFLGGKMIWGAFRGGDEKVQDSLAVRAMLTLALATSIDALAVGVSFAFLEVNIAWAVLFIGVITFVTSAAGVWIGSVFGEKYKNKAAFFGGVILVIMGIHVLLDGLGGW